VIWDARFWTEEERLWNLLLETDPLLAEKIDRRQDTGCWVWRAGMVRSRRNKLYGKLRRPLGVPNSESKIWLAHRYVRVLLIEEFPGEFEIHHWCQRHSCCMPLHCMPLSPEEHLELEAELRAEDYFFSPPPRIPVYAGDGDDELPF